MVDFLVIVSAEEDRRGSDRDLYDRKIGAFWERGSQFASPWNSSFVSSQHRTFLRLVQRRRLLCFVGTARLAPCKLYPCKTEYAATMPHSIYFFSLIITNRNCKIKGTTFTAIMAATRRTKTLWREFQCWIWFDCSIFVGYGQTVTFLSFTLVISNPQEQWQPSCFQA